MPKNIHFLIIRDFLYGKWEILLIFLFIRFCNNLCNMFFKIYYSNLGTNLLNVKMYSFLICFKDIPIFLLLDILVLFSSLKERNLIYIALCYLIRIKNDNRCFILLHRLKVRTCRISTIVICTIWYDFLKLNFTK